MDKVTYEDIIARQKQCKRIIEKLNLEIENQNNIHLALQEQIEADCTDLVCEYLDNIVVDYHGDPLSADQYRKFHKGKIEIIENPNFPWELVIYVFPYLNYGSKTYSIFSMPLSWLWDETAKLAFFAEQKALVEKKRIAAEETKKQRKINRYHKLKAELASEGIDG